MFSQENAPQTNITFYYTEKPKKNQAYPEKIFKFGFFTLSGQKSLAKQKKLCYNKKCVNLRRFCEVVFHSVPVISFNIKNTESETVAKILNDSYNIAVRAGLHCAPLAHKSFGTQDTGTVRAVVSAFTTKNDVVYFANAVSRISKNNKQKKTI